MKINVYVGFDTRNYGQQMAYEGCKRSILANTQHEVTVHQLNLKKFQKDGIYSRQEDPLAATEFTYTRFLVPYLNNYQGKAIFCDSDFIWNCDVAEVLDYLKEGQAVACVQHDYTPHSMIKMDGLQNPPYPRKNWSSLMVFNCEHPSTKKLTLDAVNSQSPAWLHRMTWASDDEIGSVPVTYNHLVGYYDEENPKVVHYTDGGPWHPGYEKVKFGELWRYFMSQYEQDKVQAEIEKYWQDHPELTKEAKW